VIWVQLTVAGIAAGAVYALAGMGLVLNYKATGVFNFAYGAIAMLVAYVYWQFRAQWHWPLPVAALVALGLVGPGIGILLERVVFRPLERKGASTSVKLVATLGVFELCLGLAFVIWTGTVRTGARIVSGRALHLGGGVTIGVDQLFVVILTAVIVALLWLVFQFTHLGTEIKAVVDRRELAELSAVNANRVAAVAWAIGAGLAGLTGVLLASGSPLDPYHFTLLVIEVFSIAVIARLVSLPIAVGAGVLFGVVQSLLSRVDLGRVPFTHIAYSRGWAQAANSLKPYLSSVLLLAFLLAYRRLGTGTDEGGVQGLVSGSIGSRRGQRGMSSAVAAVLVALAAVAAPFVLSDIDLPFAQLTVGLVVVFASIVCVTGFSGQITLGQAVIAGFGAFVSARVTQSFGVPVLLAMPIGGVAALILGVLAGLPAVKRRGLFLGLTTLAIGLLVYNFVFQNQVFAGGAGGVPSPRPSIAGWSLDGEWRFYFFELVIAGLMLLLARNLRSGRLGRILAAMRDSDTAARSIGINLRTYKLFIFGASSFIAGIGGCLIAEQGRIFNSVTSWDVFTSLLWFVAVIVAGVGSLGGAVLGAVVFELLGRLLHVNNLSTLIIAVGALFIGYLPGGSLIGILQRLSSWARTPRGLIRAFEQARSEPARSEPAGSKPAVGAVAAANGSAPVPSEFARRVLAEAGRS
jgi:branched-chain amino acid transport system permease protein